MITLPPDDPTDTPTDATAPDATAAEAPAADAPTVDATAADATAAEVPAGAPPAPARRTPPSDAAWLLPDVSRDETDEGWGERPDRSDDDRILDEVPPHHVG